MHTSATVLALALLTAISTLPAHAGAATKQDQVPQVVVRYGDLNVETEAGALALYNRIVRAAGRVCPSTGIRDLARLQLVRTCQDESVARAVAAAGIPRLAAIRDSRTMRSRAS
jgi:UrcA family protein